MNIDDVTRVPVYLELKKPNGAPALWVLLASSEDREASILDKYCFSAEDIGEEGLRAVSSETMTDIPNEDLVTKILFGQAEPPRFIVLIGMNQIALIDRNKWNDKRYLQFELEDIFSRHEETTLQAMATLLHRTSLSPEEGTALLDELDANSQKHAAGVSQDLKYALRECIELLGNEVLYDMAHRLGRNLDADTADAGQLTLECIRYMYRMLFVLFIEARPELGYAPIKAQAYLSGYSLESLRDIADDIRDDVNEVGDGYYLHETLSKLYDLIYNGYPKSEEEILKYSNEESLHDMFVIAPLKAHIFDPEFTPTITKARLRNRVMLRIIDLMSLTRETGKKNDRRGRISYANLGINQMGSVYDTKRCFPTGASLRSTPSSKSSGPGTASTSWTWVISSPRRIWTSTPRMSASVMKKTTRTDGTKRASSAGTRREPSSTASPGVNGRNPLPTIPPRC